MFEILSEMTLGEGAAVAGTGGVVVAVLSLLVKHGAKLVIGKDPDGNGKTNGNGNGKQLTPQICPAHTEFSEKLDERHAVLKEALAAIARNQEGQQKLLMSVVAEVRASAAQVQILAADMAEVKGAVTRLHVRIDGAVNGKAHAREHDHRES